MEVTQLIDDNEIPLIIDQFKLEFQQLKAYYNFRLNFKKKLREGNNKKDEIRYYLIDRNWIHKWKKHVRYNHISQNRIDNGMSNKELNDSDYKAILPYFIIFSNKYPIFPLDNKIMNNNEEINPLSDFIIIDQNCYNAFVSTGNNFPNEINKNFSVIFFKEKLILKFNSYNYFLMFKFSRTNENEIYWELLLFFSDKINENIIINSFYKLNIIQWFNENKFDLGSTKEKVIFLNNYKVKLINKTLLINERKNSTNVKLTNDIMHIMELNNHVHPIPTNLNITTNMNKLGNANNFTNNVHEVKTSSSRGARLNHTNMGNMNFVNNNTPDINTLLALENIKKNKQNEKNEIIKMETVKEVNKNSNLIYPHKIGLKKIGQTSYLNSTLQCLSNIKYLSDYFIKHYGKFDIKKQPLFASLSSLVFDLFNTKKKYISPELFKKIIGKLNPSFEGMHEADPKDLISFLLETLHQELNKTNNTPQTNFDFNLNEIDSYDENKALQNFINDFITKN